MIFSLLKMFSWSKLYESWRWFGFQSMLSSVLTVRTCGRVSGYPSLEKNAKFPCSRMPWPGIWQVVVVRIPVKLNPWIEFDWIWQSNQIEHRTLCEFNFQTNCTQSNKLNQAKLSPLDCVPSGSVSELNQTQSIGLRIVFGE